MSADVVRNSLTSALEDYLETIYELVRDQKFARVRDIARARSVKAGSVTPALKRLCDLGLIDYVQREYIRLTPTGEEAARRVFARHQLLSRFLGEVLGMPEGLAERDACALEHALSDEAMDRLVRFFEFLRVCPNSPRDFLESFHACALQCSDDARCTGTCEAWTSPGVDNEEMTMSLYDLEPGQGGNVTHVNARGAIRQRLLDMGILPDTRLELERVAPTGDPAWIKLDGMQLALRREEAESILLVVTRPIAEPSVRRRS